MSSQYQLFVYDWNGQLVHIFDSWRSLDYNLKINDINDLTLTLQDTPAVDLKSILVLDYLIEVRRRVQGYDWLTEDYFFVRTPERALQENGTYTWICYARGLNDLLDRRWIMYVPTTRLNTNPAQFITSIKTAKEGPADDVMKQFVEQNCGPTATITNSRLVEGTFPNFIVGTQIGAAPVWTGSRAYKNLLALLQEIGKAHSVDFNMQYNQHENQFVFTTSYPQAGRDLSSVLAFRPELGNMAKATHTLSRTDEATVILVNGQGEGDVRFRGTLSTDAKDDSPYNSREIVLDQRNETSSAALIDAARAKINEVGAQETLRFTSLDIPGYRYGEDFKLGDRVTVGLQDFEDIQKLVQVHINMSEGKEQIDLTFGDYMAPIATVYDALRAFSTRVAGAENSGEA